MNTEFNGFYSILYLLHVSYEISKTICPRVTTRKAVLKQTGKVRHKKRNGGCNDKPPYENWLAWNVTFCHRSKQSGRLPFAICFLPPRLRTRWRHVSKLKKEKARLKKNNTNRKDKRPPTRLLTRVKSE